MLREPTPRATAMAGSPSGRPWTTSSSPAPPARSVQRCGYVHDASPSLLQHGANHRLDSRNGRVRLVLITWSQSARFMRMTARLGDSRIVHQKCRPCREPRDRGLGSSLNFLLVADVHFERSRVSAFAVDLAGRLLQLFPVAGTERDWSRPSAYQRTCTADPLRRSGHERHSAFHSRHETSCL